VRKAGHFKGLHCQPGSIRQIEPQRQFGRVPTRGTFDVGGRRNSNRPSSAVCQHLHQRGARGLVWFHVPNGGRRNPLEASIFAGLGVKAGVADLLFLYDGQAFALELKTARGRPTAAQLQFISEFRPAGGEASIATGLDQARRRLEMWGLLRGRAA
jgi:hypothetical protein